MHNGYKCPDCGWTFTEPGQRLALRGIRTGRHHTAEPDEYEDCCPSCGCPDHYPCNAVVTPADRDEETPDDDD